MLKNKGFTLIELLVVIAIIALLSSVVFASLNSARAKARDAQRKANLNQVKLALELYFDDNSAYPSIASDNVGNYWSGLATPLASYISKIPTDPSGDSWHVIQYVRGSPTSYAIFMRYESTGYCKTGVNVNMGWWEGSTPICP